MAKASVKRNEVVVNLELSQDEAQLLFDVTGRIGGSPDCSRRKYSDSIRNALKKVKELDTYHSAGDISDRCSFMLDDGGRKKGMPI